MHGLCSNASFERKQIPRFVRNISNWKKWMESLESIGVRPSQAFERIGLTLSKNMKGLAPFWTKAKYGKMSIE